MQNLGICLPSYNEAENIVTLINQILDKNIDVIICVIDDNSPDKTHELVRKNFSNNKKVKIIKRQTKDGRGGAVWEGFNFLYNLEEDIEIFIEMDCDFSHSIEDLMKGIEIFKSNEFDVLLGSRYPDGEIVNWSLTRRFFSFLANSLVRFLIDNKIFDYTNGFRFYNQKAIKILLEKKPLNKGYIYLSESITFFLLKNLKIGSFPIYFKNRIRGKSNTNLKEIYNSIIGIFKISYFYKKQKNNKF
tara:strand:+ start:280 stop:1014 length:735 start_codon:yes stop_codon:yes gene_type:complete